MSQTTEALFEPPPESDDLFAKADWFAPRLQAIREGGQYFYRRALAGPPGRTARVLDHQTGAAREMLLASNQT